MFHASELLPLDTVSKENSKRKEMQKGNLEQKTTYKVYSCKDWFYVAHNIIFIYSYLQYRSNLCCKTVRYSFSLLISSLLILVISLFLCIYL